MDKNEYRAKLDQINDLVDRQDYKGALVIVDSIDWRRVRSARTLCMVGDIYEANKRYEDSRRLFMMAHNRAPIGRTVLYRLVELSIKMGNFDEAIEYYNQFVEISPNDNTRYILKYKIYRGRRSPIQEQIAILEDYKGREYTERWAYELARLYAKAGMKDKCIEECDDLILWFSEGKYVNKAMELKMKYAPLSPSQEAKYRSRYIEKSPEQTAAAAAASIAAATQAASRLVSASPVAEQITDEMPAIESVRSRTTGKAPEEVSVFSPIIETTGVLQDKIAKGIRDVFAGGSREDETDAEDSMETVSEENSGEELQENRPENNYDIAGDYVVKDLEPENLEASKQISPAPVKRAVAPAVKAPNGEVPVSRNMKAPEDIDLEALLAETASGFAREVAEETGKSNIDSEEKTEELSAVEEEQPVQETEAEYPVQEAEEQQPVQETKAEYPVQEAEEEQPVQEAEAEYPIQEVEEEQPVQEAEAEYPIQEVEEAQPVQKAEEKYPVQEAEEAQLMEGKTMEIPSEQVKAALEGQTIDLSSALEDAVRDAAMSMSEAAATSETSYIREEADSSAVESVIQEDREESAPVGNAVSDILRHHLTKEEQKRLFTYFAPIPGMTEQIMETLDVVQESACEKTSKSGNIIITGREGSGKTRLSEGLIKALCKERRMNGAKIAYMDARNLNEKDPVFIVDKLSGGFLVVENASSMKMDVVEKLSKAMEFKTNRLTVILEDRKPGIQSLEREYPEFMEKFDSRIVIPVFTNDELVSFAKTYSREMGYKIDDMAVLALYTLIGDNQNEEDPVSIGQVKDMMDDAIKHASKGGRRPGKKVAKRHLDDESGRIMLYEKDFDI